MAEPPNLFADIPADLPDELFETVIPRSIRLAEAPSYGLSIAEYDPRSNGATAYQKLVGELAARIGIGAGAA